MSDTYIVDENGTGWITYSSGSYTGSGVQVAINESGGISPVLYFKYVKTQFKILERIKLERRLKDLERAFDQAVENGQKALAEKFLDAVAREARESAILAKGIKYFVEEKDLEKYKYKIKDGHISDTLYKDYTRVIPKHVINRKKEVERLFDELVIYHYWNEKAKDVKKMDQDEKEKMRDPILFGKIKETDKLYFIADWYDEYCDLTFDKLIKYMGKDKMMRIGNNPDLTVSKKRKK